MNNKNHIQTHTLKVYKTLSKKKKKRYEKYLPHMWQRNARIYDGQVKIKESLHRMIREDVRTRDGLVLQILT